MRQTRRILANLGLTAFLATSLPTGRAQVSTGFEQSNIQTTPRIRVGQILPERNAKVSIATRVSGDELGGSGSTGTSVVRDTSAATEQFFRTFQEGHRRIPKVGGTRGSLRMSAPLGPQVSLPLFGRAGKPEDAELKLGRLYLDLFTLSGSVLYSDNVEQSRDNRDGEAIGIVRLQGALIFQITETMRLAAGGTVAWLPFENQIGFADPLADFTTSLQPLFLTQFEYEVPLGPLTTFSIYDNLNVVSGGFGQSRAFDTLQRDSDALVDREGRRQFIQQQTFQDQDRRFREGISIQNSVEAEISTLLPTETRVGAGFRRNNLWFAQGAVGQPSSQDIWFFRAENLRENMRFKPQINFQARHQNNRPGYDKIIGGGVSGPISDYIDFTGNVGFLLSDASDQQNILWRLGFIHRLRDLTTHSLTYTRTLTFPQAQVVKILSYRLEQILSPEWTFDFGYEHRLFEPISNANNVAGVKEDQLEGRFQVRISDRLTAIAGYSYTRNVNRGPGALRFHGHIYRLDLVYAHTDVTESSVLYQFQRRQSNRSGNGATFDENVVTYTLTRTF
ncbi:MAG: hypothetical protein ACPGVU_02775 [Limisphaerales bacterium]